MTRHHHGRTREQRGLNGRKTRHNASVIGDRAFIIAGHIQITADQNALILQNARGGQGIQSLHLHGNCSFALKIRWIFFRP